MNRIQNLSKGTTWNYIGHVASGEPFYIEGENVWNHRWHYLDSNRYLEALVKDREGNEFVFPIRFIEPYPGKKIVFAAGEYSNGVFGFHQAEDLSALV